MKNLLFVLSLSSLILFSCSSDGDGDSPLLDNDIVLLKSHTFVFENLDKIERTYIYSNNKIDTVFVKSSINNTTDDYYEKITYTGDFITKTERFNLNNQLIAYSINTIEDGNLTKITNVFNLNFPTPLITYYAYSSNGSVILTYSYLSKIERFYFSADGQMIQIDYIQSDNNQTLYTYDKKNNPYLNTAKGGDIFKKINNIIKEENIGFDGSVSVYNHNYIYNDKGYPTSESVVFENKEVRTLFYEYY